jgi:hypothetical protein
VFATKNIISFLSLFILQGCLLFDRSYQNQANQTALTIEGAEKFDSACRVNVLRNSLLMLAKNSRKWQALNFNDPKDIDSVRKWTLDYLNELKRDKAFGIVDSEHVVYRRVLGRFYDKVLNDLKYKEEKKYDDYNILPDVRPNPNSGF